MPDQPKRKPTLAGAWRETRLLLAAHRARLAVGLALILVNVPASMVLPATSKYLIDDVVGKHRNDLLPLLALAAAGGVALQAGSSFALSQLLSVAAQRAVADMRMRVQAHVARLPIAFFDASRSGQLITRIMTDAEGIRNLVGTGLVQLVGGSLTAVVAVTLLVLLNWKLTLATVVVLAGFGSVMAFAFKTLRPVFRERGEITSQVTGRLGESLGAARVVKAYVAEEREEAVFRGGVERLFRNIARTITGVSATTSMGTLSVGVIGVLMILIGGRAMLHHIEGGGVSGMSVGDFMLYLALTALVTMPVIQMAAIGTQVSEAFAGLDRIRELLSMPTEEEEHGGSARLESLRGEIAFDGVTFAYVEGRSVLHEISFTSPAGSTTALVGSSGSGKSTLVSIAMGFHRPQSGRVVVDGRDLRSLSLRDYRSALGVVFQDNVLFDGTVAENIAFSRPGASHEQVVAAGRAAGCEEFVTGFEKGWETIVGERGVKLSGGQRQRIAIARAILADPRILVLDEATSSLDSESEALVQEGLRKLRRGRTTFVIAHRLSTIRSADQILVLEHGRIVERGTHEQLHAAGGRYRQLHDRQFQLEHDRYLNPGEEPKEQPVVVPRA
jgi:subfamily B ATP-binding cassette protein MsbA